MRFDKVQYLSTKPDATSDKCPWCNYKSDYTDMDRPCSECGLSIMQANLKNERNHRRRFLAVAFFILCLFVYALVKSRDICAEGMYGIIPDSIIVGMVDVSSGSQTKLGAIVSRRIASSGMTQSNVARFAKRCVSCADLQSVVYVRKDQDISYMCSAWDIGNLGKFNGIVLRFQIERHDGCVVVDNCVLTGGGLWSRPVEIKATAPPEVVLSTFDCGQAFVYKCDLVVAGSNLVRVITGEFKLVCDQGRWIVEWINCRM